jgi:hypothetical protein
MINFVFYNKFRSNNLKSKYTIMKKLFFSLLAMCAMMLVSCSVNEDDFDQELVDVNFDFNVENVLKGRSISDGTGANTLMYGVFNEAGELVLKKDVKNNVTGLTSTGYKLQVSLAKGQTYQAVFWAQNSECEAYTVSDDMNVTVNYEGLNNDENRDAFFAVTEPFKVNLSKTVNVTLKRPFAQVNVGAVAFDLEYVNGFGVNISKSSATIKDLANTLNLLTGETSGNVDVQYSLNTIPAEALMVDVDDDGVKESYEWLSMSYVLASTEKSNHVMEFEFTDAEGGSAITFKEGLVSVPVQRNYRTNIVGQVLTGTMNYSIKLDPEYEGETITTPTGLYYNFYENTTIKDKEFALNNTAYWVTFTTENNSVLTLENVTFSGKMNQVAIGEYRGGSASQVPYVNILKNVKAEGVTVGNSISNVNTIDYMSLLFYLRGVTTLENCVLTGTKTVAKPVTDYNGTVHEVLAYDCGVPNFCEAEFNNCEVSSLYAWSHSKITVNNSKVDYIRCSTHKKSLKTSHLTIGAGTTVGKIVVSSSGSGKFKTVDGKKVLYADMWSPSLIIKAGATVEVLDYNGRPSGDVIIEEGAIIKSEINKP